MQGRTDEQVIFHAIVCEIGAQLYSYVEPPEHKIIPGMDANEVSVLTVGVGLCQGVIVKQVHAKSKTVHPVEIPSVIYNPCKGAIPEVGTLIDIILNGACRQVNIQRVIEVILFGGRALRSQES